MRIAWIVAALLGWNTLTLMADEPQDRQKGAKLDVQIRITADYLLYLPKDYDQQEKWPLVLFLHGRGESGDNLDLVKTHGLPKLIAAGKEFPFIVVSPQCPKDSWWNSDILLALLDDVERNYKVDKERIYVTGLSMGGFGTWNLTFRAPHRFAAIAPVCGGGEAYWGQKIAHVPAWVFHGAKDPVVPLSRSEIMVENMKKKGGDPKLTVYPEAAHDSWTETYNNPELYTWLLSHTLQPPKPEPEKPAAAPEKKP